MALCTLSVQSLRNLNEIELNLASMNVFYGDNGSGKTSILEAIYMLAMGRSFRSNHSHVITHGAPALYIRGVIQNALGINLKVALQKSRNNQHIIKCAGQEVASILEIAQHLPVQALHLLNYQLLQNAPESRRKLLDWGLFHVEHSFLEQWRTYNQLLKQRNAALRQQYAPETVWDELLAQTGVRLHALRQNMCEGWFPLAQEMMTQLLGLPALELAYCPGWDIKKPLLEVFSQNLSKDLALGYTYYGPQRADIQVRCSGKMAQHVLSQGQQKSVVAALQLSQSAWVYEKTALPGVLLIDDLPAELDKGAQAQMMQLLKQLNLQVCLTCVDEHTAQHLAQTLEAKLFHVKHGEVKEVCGGTLIT